MNVGDAGGGAVPGIGVVSDGKETYSLVKITFGNDFAIEVRDDGDIQGSRAAVDPVFAELIAMTGMDWLNGVAEFVQHAHKGCKRPSGTALGLPAGAIVLEWPE